jgi:uncharacterized protein YndB with AHSA1/START domain
MAEIEAKAEMLIRCSRSAAFKAFVSKETICDFWLESSSGDLGPHARVEWRFKVPGAHERVEVLTFEADRQIVFKWSDGNVVAISLSEHPSGLTLVSVVVSGFSGTEPAAQAVNATEGFAIVLCDLKSLLETGKSGGMTRDKALLIASRAPAQRVR